MNRHAKCLIISTCLIILLGLAARIGLANLGYAHADLDITTHLELTGRAYDNIPADKHYFNSITSIVMPEAGEGDIPLAGWGPSVRSADESVLVYASFSAATFIIPYTVQCLFQFEHYQNAIFLTSLIVYAISAALFALLFCRFYYIIRHELPSLPAMSAMMLFFCFAQESLVSLGGFNFWAHVLVFPFHLLILLILSYLPSTVALRSSLLHLSLFLLVFLAAFIEWSTFTGVLLLNAYLLLTLLVSRIPSSFSKLESIKLIIITSSACILALILIVAHPSMIVPIKDYFELLLNRSTGRALSGEHFSASFALSLVLLLLKSFGLFLLCLPVLLSRVGYLKKIPYSKLCVLLLLLALVGGILLENLIQFSHALIYSYARLKWFLFFIPIYCLWPKKEKGWSVLSSYLLLLFTIAGSGVNLYTVYKNRVNIQSSYWEMMQLHENKKKEILQLTGANSFEELLIGVKSPSDSFLVLDLGKMLYEHSSKDSLQSILEKSGYENAVLINSQMFTGQFSLIKDYEILQKTKKEPAL